MDQLREVFDRIDVVVRRRADQLDARGGIAQQGDVLGHLLAGQLAALAGLGALRHLDLDLLGRSEVLRRDAKAPRGHLLDLRLQGVALLEDDVGLNAVLAEARSQRLARLDGRVAVAVLPALAGVRFAADPVHRHCERGVCFGRNRAERHRAGGEALDDLRRGLDLGQRDGLGRVGAELEQAAERHVAARLVVDDLRVFLVRLRRVVARRMLQLGDRIRRPHVLFAAHPVGILAARVERVGQHRVVAEGGLVHSNRLLGDFEHADALDVGRRAGEVLVDQRARQADRLENLRAGVGHVGGDAHLRHHLAQALADRLDEILDRLVAGLRVVRPGMHGQQRFQRKVGMDRLGAVTAEQGEMMHLAGGARFDDEAGTGAQALVGQVLVDRGQREQRRNRDVVGIDLAVRDDDDRVARTHCVFGLRGKRGEARFDRLLAPFGRVADVEFPRAELAFRVALDMADLLHLVEVQHRLPDLEPDRRVHLVDPQQVGLGADERDERGYEFLADRVDRRVGDLREQLLEVVVQGLRLVGQHRERRIIAHRADRLLAVGAHRRHDELEVFLRVGERLLPVEERHGRALGLLAIGLDVVKADPDPLHPFAVGLGGGERVLELLVVDDAAFLEVDEEHLARLQAPLLDDPFFGDLQAAAF